MLVNSNHNELAITAHQPTVTSPLDALLLVVAVLF